MITCSWALVCSQSIRNQETDNLSLIEVLDRLIIPYSPVQEKPHFFSFNYELVVSWEMGDNDRGKKPDKFRIAILDPLGEILLQGEERLEVKESGQYITAIQFNGLPITEPGSYKFCLELPSSKDVGEWEEIKVVSLPVIYNSSPETE